MLNAESDIDERHKHIAYAVQDACEIAMMSAVRPAKLPSVMVPSRYVDGGRRADVRR